MEEKNVIRKKSFDFAVRVVKLCQFVNKNQHEFVLTRQLLKSGTSIGAKVRESNNAESGLDFIHKLGIAQKECDETLYCLELMKSTGYLTEGEYDSMAKDCSELMKIIRSIILTRKADLNAAKSKKSQVEKELIFITGAPARARVRRHGAPRDYHSSLVRQPGHHSSLIIFNSPHLLPGEFAEAAVTTSVGQRLLWFFRLR